MSDLEQQIRSNPLLDLIPSSSGYYQLKCPVCGDRKKRAGVKFESDKIIYSCFRGKCDASGEYVYGNFMPRKFRDLMELLGVDIPLDLKFAHVGERKIQHIDPDVHEAHAYKPINFPDDFVDYDPNEHYWFEDMMKARCVDFNRKLYVGMKDEWKYKLIVPFYHNKKLIGWQGISYNSETGKTFYLTSSGNTDILFINNEHGYIPKTPIIVEGIMDAAVIPGGIATLGNTISKKQSYILLDSDPILLPDRIASRFLAVAKRTGWRISIPEWKVKDVNEAVQKYDRMITAKMIHDGIVRNITKAEVKYNMWRIKK